MSKSKFKFLSNRNRFQSAVTIIGMSTSFAFCLLVAAFVLQELSYDSSYQHSVRMFRLLSRKEPPDGQTLESSNQVFPLGPVLQAELPEIEAVSRWSTSVGIVTVEDKHYYERLHFADHAAVTLFDMKFLYGNLHAALTQPQTVVIVRSIAKKYFGIEDVVGRRLGISMSNSSEDYVISGVVGDMPSNSSFRFGVLLPFVQHPMYRNLQQNWMRSDVNCSVVVRLREDTDMANLKAKMRLFTRGHFEASIKALQETFRLSRDVTAFQLALQPISEIRLDTNIDDSQEETTEPSTIYILIAIAVLILAVACANLVVLALGQLAPRMKEIGVRKVLGADRLTIAFHFWREALGVCVFSLVCGIVLAVVLLPLVPELIVNQIAPETLPVVPLLLVVLILVAILSGTAGFLPGVLLSRLQPAEILKKKMVHGNHFVIKVLLVFQFALAAILIAVSLVMAGQIRHMLTKELGYNPHRIVSISLTGVRLDEREEVITRLRSSLSEHVSILDISATGGDFRLSFESPGRSESAFFRRVDHRYASLLDLKFVRGRDFDLLRTTDATNAVIVNEAFLRVTHMTDGALGHHFRRWYESPQDFVIVGVIKDYHFHSLRERIGPLVLFLDNVWPQNEIIVRFSNTVSSAEVLDVIQKKWNSLFPSRPMMLSFLDEDIQRQYENDQQWLRVVLYASIFSIGLAILGLFALMMLVLKQRTKEIGIRKVLGASVTSIVGLLSSKFIGLVLLANVIGLPLGAYLVNLWLAQFAYSEELGVLVFIQAGVVELALTASTVMLYARKAALANPVGSLRYE